MDAEGTVLSENGINATSPPGRPRRWAGLIAAAEAATKRRLEEVAGMMLYTSAEPCMMYTRAVYWTGIGRIVLTLSENRLATFTGDDPVNPTS